MSACLYPVSYWASCLGNCLSGSLRIAKHPNAFPVENVHTAGGSRSALFWQNFFQANGTNQEIGHVSHGAGSNVGPPHTSRGKSERAEKCLIGVSRAIPIRHSRFDGLHFFTAAGCSLGFRITLVDLRWFKQFHWNAGEMWRLCKDHLCDCLNKNTQHSAQEINSRNIVLRFVYVFLMNSRHFYYDFVWFHFCFVISIWFCYVFVMIALHLFNDFNMFLRVFFFLTFLFWIFLRCVFLQKHYENSSLRTK